MWQHSRGTSHFCKLKTNLISFLGWRTQAANLDRGFLTLGAALTVLRRQSLRGFISHGWPEWAEPPERECSRQEGQVLQVMLAALWPGRADLALFIGKNHALGVWLNLNNLTTVVQVTCMIRTWLLHTFTGIFPRVSPKGVCASCSAYATLTCLFTSFSVQSLQEPLLVSDFFHGWLFSHIFGYGCFILSFSAAVNTGRFDLSVTFNFLYFCLWFQVLFICSRDSFCSATSGFFLRCFKDPIRVPRI